MDYVATTGPLRLFEELYVPSLRRMDGLGDLPVIQLCGGGARNRARATFLRDPAREFSFLSLVFGTLAKGIPSFLVYRSIQNSSGQKMIHALQTQMKIPWSSMKYSAADDDLVLCELKNFRSDMLFAMRFHPPRGGELLLCAVKQPFDSFDVHWRRMARSSLKAREDPFRHDFLKFAKETAYTMHCDIVGSFHLVRQPDLHTDKAVLGLMKKAAKKTQMQISVAPSLFA